MYSTMPKGYKRAFKHFYKYLYLGISIFQKETMNSFESKLSQQRIIIFDMRVFINRFKILIRDIKRVYFDK
jgi:hypothetical protein